MKNILPIAVTCFLLTHAVSAQEYVYGDPATKKYYGINCGEAEARGVRGFMSPKAAEQAGFTRGETCSKSTGNLGKLSPDWKPEPITYGTTRISVAEFRKGIPTLNLINLNFDKYRNKNQKFVGDVSMASPADAFKAFEAWWKPAYEAVVFRLSDSGGGGGGTFYTYSWEFARQIQKTLADPDRDFDIIWSCTIKPQFNDPYVFGELIDCKALRTYKD